MAARYLPTPAFSHLFRRHLRLVLGGTSALALALSAGCATETVCSFDGDDVSEEDAVPWYCDGGTRYVLSELGPSEDMGDGSMCADASYVAKTTAGAPCAVRPLPPGVVDGRPLMVDGDARIAPVQRGGGWVVADGLQPLEAIERRFLGERWLRAAQYEHASVASFARFTLDLMRFGAPPELLAAAQNAGLDEVRHAELSFALAARFLGETTEAGALDLGGSLDLAADLPSFAAEVFVEGCVGETLAAVRAAERRAVATDSQTQDVLDVLVRDEGAHAELAWRTVAWAIEAGGEPVRSAVLTASQGVRQALGGAEAGPEGRLDALREFGVLAPQREAAALVRAWDLVIAPALDGL